MWDDDHEVQELYRYTSFDRLTNKKKKKKALTAVQKHLRHQLVKKHCLQVGVPARIC